MIFDIIKDGLDYVGTNKNQVIIYYLGILIFPLVLLESYSYHIIENCLNGMINNKETLPDITINPPTFIKGIKLLLLKIAYYIPEIIILIIAIILPKVNYYYLITILIILTLTSYYLSQIASILLVETGQFKEGFNHKKIITTIKTVGITYIELILASILIILGIIGVTIILSGIIMLLSGISTTLFIILTILMTILYIAFLIIIIPIYVLFKNRAIVSIYNLT